ncbi:hypothetical protein BGZ51_009167 [Haplosporangium sp. Z 767]|nr:hypothetical protein BGZ50_009328 [Haplosporangium sp. Z 11]KAF9177113.1 hypothetical protein BGZ51_009167 [Haplosporangium sp. Z 767]
MPISRDLITQWDKDFNKVRFDVAHGRGDKRTLTYSPVDLVQYLTDKAVDIWLAEARKENSVVSGIQLQAAADSIFYVLIDDVCGSDDISLDCTASFTASWLSRMKEEYGVVYCRLKGEATSVDKGMIAERVGEIREVCS